MADETANTKAEMWRADAIARACKPPDRRSDHQRQADAPIEAWIAEHTVGDRVGIPANLYLEGIRQPNTIFNQPARYDGYLGLYDDKIKMWLAPAIEVKP